MYLPALINPVAEEQQQKQQQQRNGERSAALERAYVHDVYENNCDDSSTSIQPRVAQFLSNLEPGSLVCDVGCGNGRYLNACNPYIFSIGVDRCARLTKEACARGEVTVCDNLELPFRNETYDAVLSLAVIHHFATTERRINAIRELARILRIGGRVIITVWAFEQKQRRFESQDVLIPTTSAVSLRYRNVSDDEDDEDYLPPYHAYTEESNSSRSAGDGDSSSLSSSSPGESCYSFVRKTIQKLAGGRRHPWLDSWNSRDTKNDNSLDIEDAKDLPIELRRLDDFEDLPEPPLAANLKSRSLSNLNPPLQPIVRSLSSVPSLTAPDSVLQRSVHGNSNSNSSSERITAPAQSQEVTKAAPSDNRCSRRPKLVKQKQSLCDERSFVGIDEETSARVLLRKQSSLNEEYLSEGRQREKERIRKRIHKQISLNETFLYQSLFSKKLQVIKEGLTTKLRTSSESMERLKNTGIGRLFQNLKSSPQTAATKNGETTEINSRTTEPADCPPNPSAYNENPNQPMEELDEEGKPRRRSRESGSDSSKDSLQSDTSIESEDSFASVIYIPRPEQQQQQQQQSCLQAPDSMSTINSNMCFSRTPTSPLPCPTPAQSPAPLKGQTLCHFEYIDSMTGCPDDAKNSINKRFTFDFEIPDNTTENLLNKNSSLLFEQKQTTPKQEQLQGVRTGAAAASTVAAAPVNSNMSSIVPAKKRFEIPPIPKFSGSSTGSLKKMASYPILRRSAATPVVPKLVSLEIYNPETDDSDSSEPSSPDSVDSVINALESVAGKPKATDDSANVDVKPTELMSVDDIPAPERKATKEQPTLEEFAKQLNAQLKELNETEPWNDLEREPSIDSGNEELDVGGERKDRSQLREELRNRRLMLANLNGSNLKRYSQFSGQLVDGSGSDLTIHEDVEEDDVGDDLCSDVCDVAENRAVEHQLHLGNSFNETVYQRPIEEDRIPLIESTDYRPSENGTSYRHSNSSMSLESPGGGSVTHHRYYHVFREGELDALINHHVLDLHITSSYYDRSMWCIVAEKVQVWTI